MTLTNDQLALTTARFGVMRFGAFRFGFAPKGTVSPGGATPGPLMPYVAVYPTDTTYTEVER